MYLCFSSMAPRNGYFLLHYSWWEQSTSVFWNIALVNLKCSSLNEPISRQENGITYRDIKWEHWPSWAAEVPKQFHLAMSSCESHSHWKCATAGIDLETEPQNTVFGSVSTEDAKHSLTETSVNINIAFWRQRRARAHLHELRRSWKQSQSF